MGSLLKYGWHLSEESIVNYFGDDLPTTEESVHKLLLDTDIRQIDDPTAAPRKQLTNNGGDIVVYPLILQIQKIRNVAVTKSHEHDPSASSRLLRIHLTDGKTTFSALEMEPIKGLDVTVPPGTKILITNAVHNERGFLLLKPSNCRILGGKVEKLIEKWQFKDSNALSRPRPADGQSGPPPWIPFGQKPQVADGLLTAQTRDLRVMDLAASGQQDAPPVSEEFNQARQNVIAQAMKQDKGKSNAKQH